MCKRSKATTRGQHVHDYMPVHWNSLGIVRIKSIICAYSLRVLFCRLIIVAGVRGVSNETKSSTKFEI